MSKEVNLISSRRKESSATYKQIGIIRKLSFAILGVSIIVAILLIGFNNTTQIGSLSTKEQALDKTLLLSKSKIIKLALIKDRLANIKNLVNVQSSYELVIDDLSKSLPRDSTFDSFEISKTRVSLVVSSGSLLSINTFLDYVIGKVNSKNTFQKVTVSSLVGDLQTGRYLLSLDITLL